MLEHLRSAAAEQRAAAVVCASMSVRTPVEIVGMPIDSAQQRAYVHLMAEAKLLEQGGAQGSAKARAAVRRLKRQSLKTEPAFAQYFGLKGAPYVAVAG